jgi:HIV Tat-specific factor 1
MIAESAETNLPRIKMYADENGDFKGEALIVYFRPESVKIAINMSDDSDFRLGEKVATGPMRVTEADSSYKSQKELPLTTDAAKTKGTQANRSRNKAIKKKEEMNSRLADWDDDDPQAIQETSSRWDKVIVLKHMFTPELFEKEPEALLDIKEDVMEECEKLGEVTNVVLYDKEEDGVVTVRFANAISAEAAVKVFNGRMFDGRKVCYFSAENSGMMLI